MALALTTITHAIAGLTISGVTIKDIHEIPAEIQDRDCPMLFPEPVNFVTDLTATRKTQITATTAWDVEYTLTYTLAYAPLGSGRQLDLVSPMLTKAFVCIDAILAAVAGINGSVTTYLAGITDPGTITDPSNNPFFGCQFQLRILEFVN